MATASTTVSSRDTIGGFDMRGFSRGRERPPLPHAIARYFTADKPCTPLAAIERAMKPEATMSFTKACR